MVLHFQHTNFEVQRQIVWYNPTFSMPLVLGHQSMQTLGMTIMYKGQDLLQGSQAREAIIQLQPDGTYRACDEDQQRTLILTDPSDAPGTKWNSYMMKNVESSSYPICGKCKFSHAAFGCMRFRSKPPPFQSFPSHCPHCGNIRSSDHFDSECPSKSKELSLDVAPWCYICQMKGHSSYVCREFLIDQALFKLTWCKFCCEQGHPTGYCPQSPHWCRICRHYGHQVSGCIQKRFSVWCNNCENWGHMERDCPRKFIPPWKNNTTGI